MQISKDNLAGLVLVDDAGELRTSSLVIAAGMKHQHASTIKLIRRHLLDLEQFGRVGFSVQPFDTNGGRQSREVAMLNRDQATLLICLMKNSKEVVRFKVGLVREFARMKDELDRRSVNLWQQMQALVAKEVESQVRASFGSHLMLVRKKEKPVLLTEREKLEAAIQPSLLN